MFEIPAIPAAPAATPPPPQSRGRPRARATLVRLQEQISRIERRHGSGPVDPAAGTPRYIPLHVPAIDAHLPGGLARSALHEAASGGPDTEHAAAATLFVGGLLAKLDGPVLWVLRQADLFAPGLAAVGLGPDRLIFAEAGRDVLAVMEEGLRHRGLAAVVGEPAGRISLVASRRLQLAAEQSGVMAMLIRRSQAFDDPRHGEPTAAFTRWRVGALSSAPLSSAPLAYAPLAYAPLAYAPSEERVRWRLDLLRSRGGKPGSWIVEACDATGCLGMAAVIADRSDQAA
ncbi:MAG TPA: damage-inducible protein [Rhodopila sp.]|uniref:ImuA family protein n=1 Tax=Rhodopila sp. TaxID=2480087 RepID=UPI002CE0B46F|nr:damage-inducible protein [Rhodopila sp.]HVY17038.1 damage-inducible protein [Rhodopila sp.]